LLEIFEQKKLNYLLLTPPSESISKWTWSEFEVVITQKSHTHHNWKRDEILIIFPAQDSLPLITYPPPLTPATITWEMSPQRAANATCSITVLNICIIFVFVFLYNLLGLPNTKESEKVVIRLTEPKSISSYFDQTNLFDAEILLKHILCIWWHKIKNIHYDFHVDISEKFLILYINIFTRYD
jgi:hypothetical protein